MPEYTPAPTFTTGQILGRSNLGILRDNLDYFNGLADRWRVVPSGEAPTSLTNSPYVVWDGYHYLEADATTLNYYIGSYATSGTTVPVTVTLYYDYGGSGQVTVVSQVANDDGAWHYSYGTYDLSGFSAGLYRVYCEASWSGPPSGRALCRAPYTTYTGTTYTYGTPSYVTDGQLSTITEFNQLGTNQAYFNACRPRQPGFCEQDWTQNPVAGETESVIWSGWIRHRHETIQYSVDLDYLTPTSSNTNTVRVYYDYGGSDEDYEELSGDGATDTTLSGSWDLTASTYTPGTWYRVTVTMYRSNTAHKAAVDVNYLFTSPTAADSSYTVLDDYTIAQYVYGDTGTNTDFIRLQTNDINVFERLCWNATVGRMDFAVKVPMTEDSDCSGGAFRLVHRYDTLYYRGTDLQMTWGTESSQGLDDVTSGVGELDLHSVRDLAYGQVYTIEKSSTDGTLLFAQERP